ncbi:MBL fold metallo-hydrolase [Luteimonas huabeiensis]|uniref:MBL fold metallo-hydrolase n=1 Tax=Luteimonas huabeiensis TaxID=1244513 RepID=UPI00046753B5|nr:MBL fold metallo-hydrolase [Luteimonas huabeiensis]
MSPTKTHLVLASLAIAFFQMPSAHAQGAFAPQHPVRQQAGSYAVRIGDVGVTSLTDGTVPIDLHPLLHGAATQEIDRLLEASFQRNPVETSINVFLLTLPGHRVLVDTGAGQLFGAGKGGRLIERLAAQGLRPEDVTDVLLTHAHSDHAGGLVEDGRRVFPNAIVHVGQPDVEFFFDDGQQARTGYDQRYFDIARLTLKPYLDAGQVRSFSGTREILPGITATVHPGHTPGSAFFRLASAGESITFVGDIVHAGAVQFPRPEVTIAYDQDQARAAAVREAQFASFARERTLIAAPHLPFPGIGYLRAGAAGGYDWVPVAYTDREER